MLFSKMTMIRKLSTSHMNNGNLLNALFFINQQEKASISTPMNKKVNLRCSLYSVTYHFFDKSPPVKAY